jgi:hypothetical protein
MIRVDGTTYTWLGDSRGFPTETQSVSKLNQTLTPTSTILDLQAGPVQVTLTFLSPIEVSHCTSESLHTGNECA